MRNIRTFTVGALSAAILATAPANALTTDAPMVGDWACDLDLRVYITRFGSIEIMGGEPSYRAGLIDVDGETMTVTWDEGGETAVIWTLVDGALTLDGLTDEPISCVPRE